MQDAALSCGHDGARVIYVLSFTWIAVTKSSYPDAFTSLLAHTHTHTHTRTHAH